MPSDYVSRIATAAIAAFERHVDVVDCWACWCRLSPAEQAAERVRFVAAAIEDVVEEVF